MGRLNLYDHVRIERHLKMQQQANWDLVDDIDWQRGVDLTKPFVCLDDQAFFFPWANQEQRLALSQLMGLIIAAAIYEMEEALLNLQEESFERFYQAAPVSPEFYQMGVQFFEEERKHSQAFHRFTELTAEALGVEHTELREVLPVVENTRTVDLLHMTMKRGGGSFWWVVAIVEQQFLHIFNLIRPYRDTLDPLYYQLHQLHFEEEAKHAPFPYLMIELLERHNPNVAGRMLGRFDLALAQGLQTMWALSSLKRLENMQQFKGRHDFFDVLLSTQNKLKDVGLAKIVWRLLTQVPYVSSLINPHGHAKIQKLAGRKRKLSIPFPDCEERKVVNY